VNIGERAIADIVYFDNKNVPLQVVGRILKCIIYGFNNKHHRKSLRFQGRQGPEATDPLCGKDQKGI
jgi:hypothetical protein